MLTYIIRRLILLPITLFFIVLVNFVIINLAPGEPSTVTEISQEGTASRQQNKGIASSSDERYLQFREYYGLTLPILFNPWPSITLTETKNTLWILIHHRLTPETSSETSPEMSIKDYDALRITFGDQSRFIMPHLLTILNDPQESLETKALAAHFFIRGGSHQAFLGAHLSEKQKLLNQQYAKDNDLLRSLDFSPSDPKNEITPKIQQMNNWYEQHKITYDYHPSFWQKVKIFFLETRFVRYFSRVLTLDFGTLRNDETKTVVDEVVRRFKYSLTLSITPMIITFILCQCFGFIMAYKQNRWEDLSLNIFFLILYAIPIFVATPFLIDMALNRHFPFTSTPIPISGFTSPDAIYFHETSKERLFDTLQHLFLPLIAIMYGSLAAQARLCRTAVLEVLRQDYVRTAWAKGVPPMKILFKHVGRNSAITIVTSIASSLGIVLGGSLIVETLFEIHGFGKFFYDAVINRDYNVIMFSALAGSFLTLAGYLVADIAYTLLDPRVTLE